MEAVTLFNDSTITPLQISISGDVFSIIERIFVTALFTWILNRGTLKFKPIAILTELTLSWFLFLVVSPILILVFGGCVICRMLTSIRLKLQFGNKIFLASVLDSIWACEPPGSISTCVVVCIVEGHVSLDNFRNSMKKRVLNKVVNNERIYECMQRVLRRFHGFTCWERIDNYDINVNVDYFSSRSTKRKDHKKYWTDEDIFEELQELQDISLNSENRSPWEALVIPNYSSSSGDSGKAQYAIVFRAHHSIMDGISFAHMIHCLADKPFAFTIDSTALPKSSQFEIRLGKVLAFVNVPRVLIKTLIIGALEKIRFSAPTLTGPKTYTWSPRYNFETIKDLKNKSKTSTLSILFSCAGGALKKLCVKNKLKVPKVLHAASAVAMLPYPDTKPRNWFSFIMCPILIGCDNFKERLQTVSQSCRELASSSHHVSNFYLMHAIGLLPSALLEKVGSVSHATICFSNNPGPKESVRIMNGDTMLEYVIWTPLKITSGIGVAVVTFEDHLRVAFIGDRATLPNPEDVYFLRDEFENELIDLLDQFGIEHSELFVEKNRNYKFAKSLWRKNRINLREQ